MSKQKQQSSMIPQNCFESHTSSFPDQRSFVGYQLHVHLKQGLELSAKDSCGTSDPYVKFFLQGRLVYRSKTIYKDLNPFWDEAFIVNVEDLSSPLDIKVYDYDFALRDDFMGEASLTISDLELEKCVDFVLALSESGKPAKDLGQLYMTIKLTRKCDSPSSIISASSALSFSLLSPTPTSTSTLPTKSPNDQARKVFCKPHQNSKATNVNIVLVEGKDLLAMDLNGTSDPYCKFRLSNERYKSKPIYETLNPRWVEQFDLTLYEDHTQELEITVWDKDQRTKDDFMGRCSVDLSILEPEITHEVWLDIEDGDGKLFLLITISGKSYGRKINKDEEAATLGNRFKDRYSWRSAIFSANFFDVGVLEMKVFCAKGLCAADLGGKSDPFAVFELDNSMRRTQTEYKTVNPSWQRLLEMPIRDIHSVLYVTVYDEDRNHRSEFLGKICIPLLRIESGKKRWYDLKDKKLRGRAKGNNPKILLELNLVWSRFRAAVRTLNPKEERYLATIEKFKRQIFLSNVMRIKAVVVEFINVGKFIQSCLEWNNPVRSTLAFAAFLTIAYSFEPYMFPVALLAIFLKNYFLTSLFEPRSTFYQSSEESVSDVDEDEILDDREEDKEEKKSLKAKLVAIQEVTAMVQNALGAVASMAEEVKNTFNFSVPFLSWLAVGILVVITLILYFISLRFLVIVWGINKFSKKLFRPNYVPNNEVLDFLSRVPDDEEIQDRRELKSSDNGLSQAKKHAAATEKSRKKTK